MANKRNDSIDLAERFAKALQALAKDLTLMSESNYPYKAFCAAAPRSTSFSPETFRTALGIGRRYTIDMSPADKFFQRYQDPEYSDPDGVAAYALLKKVMKAVLTDHKIVYVRGENVVKVRFYLFGRMEDGSLAGLMSTAIET